MAKAKETYSKKEKEKKRQKQKQEKREKMEERKANSNKGKSLEDMIAYIDEDGNISDTPPDPRNKKIFKTEDIQIGVPKQDHTYNPLRTGTVIFFNEDKGFGFVNDSETGERIFVHANNLPGPVKENDKIIFEIEKGSRGPVAVNIQMA